MNADRAQAVWAVVPVKAFERGKSRLGGVLSDPVRAAFARGLFEHVAGTLRAVPRIRGVIVVTHDPEVSARATELGLLVAPDPPEPTLARVVDTGLAAAEAQGASAAFVCMADLPRMSVADVDAVLDALREHAVVVVPDLVQAGTNVLCVSPPRAFASCFGRGDSFVQHVTQAKAHGLEPAVLRIDGLCFDVDGPEDLAKLP